MNLADGGNLLQHLIVDRMVKIAIVAIALVVLAIGMAVIWRRGGRR
jgi:hypothetical protein